MSDWVGLKTAGRLLGAILTDGLRETATRNEGSVGGVEDGEEEKKKKKKKKFAMVVVGGVILWWASSRISSDKLYGNGLVQPASEKPSGASLEVLAPMDGEMRHKDYQHHLHRLQCPHEYLF